jgi:hypothetical protein
VSNVSTTTSTSELLDGGNAAVKSKLEALRSQLDSMASQQEQHSQRAAFVQSERIDSLFDCCDQLSKMLTVESEHRAQTDQFLSAKLEKMLSTLLVNRNAPVVGGSTVAERLNTELDAVESSIELLVTRAERVQWDLDDFQAMSISSEQQREAARKAFKDKLAAMYTDVTAASDARIAYEVRFTSDIQSEITSLMEKVAREQEVREKVLSRCRHVADDVRRSTLVPGTEQLSSESIAARLHDEVALDAPITADGHVTIVDIKTVVKRLKELVQEDTALRIEGHSIIQSTAMDAMRKLH